jgi:Tfp pilus assembly protein PilV
MTVKQHPLYYYYHDYVCTFINCEYFVVVVVVVVVLALRNHATLQRNNRATLQRNNRATLQRNNLATLHATKQPCKATHATITQPYNATITQ